MQKKTYLEFSRCLSWLLDERGLTAAQAAEICGVERTNMYYMTTGKRCPAQKSDIQKIIRGLLLSSDEAQELANAWEIDHIGRECYDTRMFVRDMINELGAIANPVVHFSFLDQELTGASSDSSEMEQSNFVQGIYHVQDLVYRSFLEESADGHICMYLQPNEQSTSQYLSFLVRRFPKMKIEHIICFQNTAHRSNALNNLAIFKQIIPAILGLGDYYPYYFYGNAESYRTIPQPMPFYIILSDKVILLNADLTAAAVLRSPKLISWYREQFDAMLERSKPLAQTAKDARQVMAFYYSQTYVNMLRDDCYQFDPQPSLIQYAPPEMIKKYMSPALQNATSGTEIMALYISNVTKSRENGVPTVCYFSRAGIRQIFHGILTGGTPTELYSKIEPEDAAYLVGSLADDIRENGRRKYLLKPGKLTLSEHINIYSAANSLNLIITAGESFCSIYLEESSIVSAFHDFAQSVADSDWIDSQEKCLQFLKNPM